MKIILCLLGICITALLLTGCQSAPSTNDLAAVKPFSLQRYLGTWYEIARLPHSFEKDMTDVRADYTLLKNGNVQVVNSGMEKGSHKQVKGIAKFKGASDCGELKVSFFRPFYGDYRIVYLEEDYSIAIVTSSTRNYLWLLARTPSLEQDVLDKLLDRISAMGFDCTKLQFP